LKYAIMTLPPIIIHSIFGLKLNRGKKWDIPTNFKIKPKNKKIILKDKKWLDD
jgi:hypothetical protein